MFSTEVCYLLQKQYFRVHLASLGLLSFSAVILSYDFISVLKRRLSSYSEPKLTTIFLCCIGLLSGRVEA